MYRHLEPRKEHPIPKSLHEDFVAQRESKQGSERSFGLVFAIVFLVVGLLPLKAEGETRVWALLTSVVFGLLAFLAPSFLGPLNKLWLKFGEILGRVVNPIVMLVIFLLILTPLGLAARLFGKDFLSLRLDSQAQSYWVVRETPGPMPDTMENQF